MTETGRAVLETAGALVALALGLCALAAIVWKVVMMPAIRTHLLEPVKETNRQVSVNGHADPRDPTLKDSVHHLQQQYEALRTDIATAAFMFEGHIQASEKDRGDLWRELFAIRGDPIPPRHDDDPRHRRPEGTTDEHA